MELVCWSLRKRVTPDRLIRLVKATYQNTETVVRTPYGPTASFPIEVGLQLGSASVRSSEVDCHGCYSLQTSWWS